MTTQSGTTSAAISMMPQVKSSGVKPDSRCCGVGQEGSPVVKGRSAHTRNVTMNIGMEEGSRRHGGIRDSTQNETFLPSIYKSNPGFSKSHHSSKEFTVLGCFKFNHSTHPHSAGTHHHTHSMAYTHTHMHTQHGTHTPYHRVGRLCM